MSYFDGFGGLYLHGFFCLILVFGLVLFTAWLLKTLDKKQLLTWALILVAAGVVGILISGLGFEGFDGYRGMMGSNYFQQYNK